MVKKKRKKNKRKKNKYAGFVDFYTSEVKCLTRAWKHCQTFFFCLFDIFTKMNPEVPYRWSPFLAASVLWKPRWRFVTNTFFCFIGRVTVRSGIILESALALNAGRLMRQKASIWSLEWSRLVLTEERFLCTGRTNQHKPDVRTAQHTSSVLKKHSWLTALFFIIFF